MGSLDNTETATVPLVRVKDEDPGKSSVSYTIKRDVFNGMEQAGALEK